MARNITDFLYNFDGGAKPNLYEVSIFPANSNIDGNVMGGKNNPSLTFQAKGAQLPESSVGEIIVPYLGRQIKVPGDRVYQDLTLTVISDEAMGLRKEFDKWNGVLNGHTTNTPDGSLYTWTRDSVADIVHLSREGKYTHGYTLYGVFPKEVSSIDLAYDNNDTVMEFTVTLAYTYHTPLIPIPTTDPPEPGSGVGS